MRIGSRVEEPTHGWPGEEVAREAAGVVTRLLEGEQAPDGGAIAYVTYAEEGVKNHPVLWPRPLES